MANNPDAPVTSTARKVCAKKEYLRYRVWYLAAERDWTVLIESEYQLTLRIHTQSDTTHVTHSSKYRPEIHAVLTKLLEIEVKLSTVLALTLTLTLMVSLILC